MEKVCQHCGVSFLFTEKDQEFLEKLSPTIKNTKYTFLPPTHCPTCRHQRRMALRNENKLYHRTCDFTEEKIISLYAPESPHTVYKEDIWYGDDWDARSYGREIDFSRSFFEQLGELRLAVPRRSMQQDGGTIENSDYSTYGLANRNCYLTFTCGMCEDVYYSTWMSMCKSCVDCLVCHASELLYECNDCKNCYQCLFCEQCNGCQDSYLLENCRNCHHCICCKNLRNKGYHIFNRPVSKAEFEKAKAALHAGGFTEKRKEFDAWRHRLPSLYAFIKKSENCTGNVLENCRNCQNCFDILLGAEDLRHCQYCGWKGKDMMDCCFSGKESELLYEMMGGLTLQRCAFSISLQMCSDCYYCDSLKHCDHCFGCIGIQHKKFCILNKQYTEEEYFNLLPQLVTHMQNPSTSSGGEWGENLPIRYSFFPYNDTLAHERWPLSKEQALQKGCRWQERQDGVLDAKKILPGKQLPTLIEDIPDDILNWAIQCEKTQKLYRITHQELNFYRRMRIPVPKLHFFERHKARLQRRLPHSLWERPCMKCHETIFTAYAPERPEQVYCEKCYLNETYNVQEEQESALNQKTLHRTHMAAKSFVRKADAAALYVKSKL